VQEAEHPTDPGTPALALHAVTLWVLDEADRLLDLGFADDLHAVRRLLLERSSAIARPSQEDGAQRDHDAKLPRLWCMMFSATWSAATRTLAAAVLSRCDGGPLQIHVGATGPYWCFASEDLCSVHTASCLSEPTQSSCMRAVLVRLGLGF
jgi:superfamily II DNA/RNA helicase